MRNSTIPPSDRGAIAPMGIVKANKIAFALGSRKSHRDAPRHITNEKKTKPALNVTDPSRFEEQDVKRRAITLPRTALQIATTVHSRTDALTNSASACAVDTS